VTEVAGFDAVNSIKRILYLGLDPIHYPCIGEITHWPILRMIPYPLSEPRIDKALRDFPYYSHLIITSKTTVAILQNYLPQLGIDLRCWAEKMTLAVGHITAKHLQGLGVKPLKIAQEETAEGLVNELKQLSLEQAHVFWPHSAKARPVIKNFLSQENICHTTCALYDSSPQTPGDLPSLETFDEIVFTSPSTVEAFLQIFGEFPSKTRCLAIGPITLESLSRNARLRI